MTMLIAVLTGGGLSVIGGLATGWLTDWLGARRDGRRYSHELEMARETRRQERLDLAYTELGRHLSRSADWARSVRPFRGSYPAPALLPPEEQWRIETLVTGYGSEEVTRLLELWQEEAAKIRNADAIIWLSEQSRDPDPDPEFMRQVDAEHAALDGYKEAMRRAGGAVRAQMRRELAGEENPTPVGVTSGS